MYQICVFYNALYYKTYYETIHSFYTITRKKGIG